MDVYVEENCFAPERMHVNDAGLDLYSPTDIIIPAHSRVAIDVGNHFKIPEGSVGFVKSRSSLMKRGIRTDGTIDEPYRGSITVVLFNDSDEDVAIYRENRIAQLVILPCLFPEVTIVDEETFRKDRTDRGDGGFGSTGR